MISLEQVRDNTPAIVRQKIRNKEEEEEAVSSAKKRQKRGYLSLIAGDEC